jgi:prepilin-type N-terminal cleavage/methylation domain-containing protein
MKNLLSKKKGFTLIELLVVIGIIMLLSFMAINGYMDYRKTTLLSLAGDNILSQINEQKTRTVYGETEDSAKCYGVYFDAIGDIYSFSQDFETEKEFNIIKNIWEYTGCGDFLFGDIADEDKEVLERDDMVTVVDNGDVFGTEIRFTPTNGEEDLFENPEFSFTLKYGDLDQYQKEFTYKF